MWLLICKSLKKKTKNHSLTFEMFPYHALQLPQSQKNLLRHIWIFLVEFDIQKQKTKKKYKIGSPTDGGNGARVTIWGSNFPTMSNINWTATIDGNDCTNIKHGGYIDPATNYGNISCVYGAGVSGYSTDGYAAVKVSYFYENKTANIFVSKSSFDAYYFNYSYPNISTITVQHTQNKIQTFFLFSFFVFVFLFQ